MRLRDVIKSSTSYILLTIFFLSPTYLTFSFVQLFLNITHQSSMFRNIYYRATLPHLQIHVMSTVSNCTASTSSNINIELRKLYTTIFLFRHSLKVLIFLWNTGGSDNWPIPSSRRLHRLRLLKFVKTHF